MVITCHCLMPAGHPSDEFLAQGLAMNVAHYEMKYGEMSLQDRLAMTYVADELSVQQNELITKGMDTLVGVLGSVIQGMDGKTEH